MGAGGKMLVAPTATAPFSYDDGLVGVGEVMDEFAGLVVVEQGADRDLKGGVLAGLAGAVGAEAMAAALGLVLGVEAEVD